MHRHRVGALLRGGEALGLTQYDVALPGDERLSDYGNGCCGVLVRDAKAGGDQVAIIDDARISHIVKRAVSRAKTREDLRLFHCSFSHLLRAVRTAAKDVGLDPDAYTTHSCRHGGALHLYMRGASVRCIAVRGRWQSDSTLKVYLEAGKASLLTLRISPSSSALMAQFGATFNSQYRTGEAASGSAAGNAAAANPQASE